MTLVSPSDSPDTQLRKLYGRAQQLRYLSYDDSEDERKRQNLKENKSVEDALKHGYAYPGEINFVFIALARAAGFDSALVRVKSRAKGFFIPELPDPDQLDETVVWVRAGGKDYFLDPATQYCPFDLLPWEETGVSGVVFSERGLAPLRTSPNWSSVVTMPSPASSQATMERRADLQLTAGGNVEGTVSVTFAGQEALERRREARSIDDVARKKLLEEEVKGWLPAGADIKLQGTVNWEQGGEPLRFSVAVKVQDYAALTGRRLLFREAFFNSSVNAFKSDKRIHDIYFPYPHQESDDITWKLPFEFKPGSLPDRRENSTVYGKYVMSVETSPGVLHATRQFTNEVLYIASSYYIALRAYLNIAKLGDESQIVLEKADTSHAQ